MSWIYSEAIQTKINFMRALSTKKKKEEKGVIPNSYQILSSSFHSNTNLFLFQYRTTVT